MDLHKLISDILEGKACVVSFDNAAPGCNKDTVAGVLSALNFARLAFAAERGTPATSQILMSLCSRKTIDSTLAICRDWSSSVHLQVEDMYRIPLFEGSLKLVSTDYNSPTPDYIAGLLKDLRALGSSAAILITRYPDVITCMRLQVATRDVFVLFNPRVQSEHEPTASLTFSTSLPHVVRCLCDIFPLENVQASQANLTRQAKLLEKCTVHIFVPRATSCHTPVGEDALIVSSLTLLSLRAELDELTSHNVDLKREKQQLEKNIVDLQARLQEEKTRAKSTQPSKTSVKTSTRGPFLTPVRYSYAAQSSPERDHFFDADDEMDPNLQFALQLQATFDSENELLLKQKGKLIQTAQRQYHCGVCLDDFPEDDAVHIDACGHEICRDCARGHVCSKIGEHRFPVLCPVCMADHKNQNPGMFSGALVQLLGISEEQWATWVEMEIAQFSIPVNCRKCHHSGFVDRLDIESQSEIRCPFPACDHTWCKKCDQTIESGGPKHSCDGTSELDHLMKQQGWRYCPNCKTPIQKIQGCNHLSCIAPGCNTHFCYRCGETINRTAIPREIQDGKAAHFRNCSLLG